jgi:hypothetical protein
VSQTAKLQILHERLDGGPEVITDPSDVRDLRNLGKEIKNVGFKFSDGTTLVATIARRGEDSVKLAISGFFASESFKKVLRQEHGKTERDMYGLVLWPGRHLPDSGYVEEFDVRVGNVMNFIYTDRRLEGESDETIQVNLRMPGHLKEFHPS